MRARAFTPEQVDRMYEMYKSGIPYREIAEKIGRPGTRRSTIYRTFIRYKKIVDRMPNTLSEVGAPFHVFFNRQKYALNGISYINTKTRSTLLRDLWEYHFGPIPDGAFITRRKPTLLDNSPENLTCRLRDGEFHNPKRIR